MKVLFKNTTKYTKENCNQFLQFHQNKYGKKELAKVAGITILYIVIFNIVYKNWIFLLSALAVGVVLYFVNRLQTEKRSKKKNKVKVFTFYFYDRYMKVKYKKEFERLPYFRLHKIFETNQYFYLYLDEKSSFILDKAGFEVGTAAEFSKFIKAKCPLKYSKQDKH